MASKTILINRAPVLTLWAAVVARRLGLDKDEALTLGWGAKGELDPGLMARLAKGKA